VLKLNYIGNMIFYICHAGVAREGGITKGCAGEWTRTIKNKSIYGSVELKDNMTAT
jgi:hypothetical protein